MQRGAAKLPPALRGAFVAIRERFSQATPSRSRFSFLFVLGPDLVQLRPVLEARHRLAPAAGLDVVGTTGHGTARLASIEDNWRQRAGPDLLRDRNRRWSADELISLAGTAGRAFYPRTDFAYCDTKYLVLSKLVQASAAPTRRT